MKLEVEGKRVFLSGPMTGYQDWNRAEFAKWERRCIEQGAREVYNPARYAPHGESNLPHEHYMRLTLHELTRFKGGSKGSDPFYDMLFLLPGWTASEGAKAELQAAKACGVAVFELE